MKMGEKTRFFLVNLARGMGWLAILVLLFIIIRKNIDINFLVWLEPIFNNTRLIFTETPANPTLVLTDIAAVAEIARARGIPLLLCTVAVNLRNCAPLASDHRAGLDEAALARWQAAYDEGFLLLGKLEAGIDEANRPEPAGTTHRHHPADARILLGDQGEIVGDILRQTEGEDLEVGIAATRRERHDAEANLVWKGRRCAQQVGHEPGQRAEGDDRRRIGDQHVRRRMGAEIHYDASAGANGRLGVRAVRRSSRWRISAVRMPEKTSQIKSAV